MQHGELFWRNDKQFGRIKGANGEAVIFDDDTVDHDLDLEREHTDTRVGYEARKIPSIANTYYATKARMADERITYMASANCLDGRNDIKEGTLSWMAPNDEEGLPGRGQIKERTSGELSQFVPDECDHNIGDLTRNRRVPVKYWTIPIGGGSRAKCVRKQP